MVLSLSASAVYLSVKKLNNNGFAFCVSKLDTQKSVQSYEKFLDYANFSVFFLCFAKYWFYFHAEKVFSTSFAVCSMASLWPVRAAKGANWAARWYIDIWGRVAETWCGWSIISSYACVMLCVLLFDYCALAQ